ncbi:hypothetical protein HanIR_Chr15g0770011 [Helianthus annuus]|nr:hypothetical protein HanIR_Chr15g0770011 [Helianthus annuus]
MILSSLRLFLHINLLKTLSLTQKYMRCHLKYLMRQGCLRKSQTFFLALCEIKKPGPIRTKTVGLLNLIGKNSWASKQLGPIF